MRRIFVKNILFVIAVNVLVKPIWVFFIDRTVQNTVPGASYGTYQALFSLSIIFQMVLDFGISSYNSRVISQDPGKLPQLFPSMLSARLVLMGVYMILAWLWAYAFGYRGWELHLLTGILLIQSLNALVTFIRSNVAALQRFKTDGLLSVIDRLLMIVICGFLLTWPATARHFRIEWFVITQIICYFIAAVAGYTILMRIGKVRLTFQFRMQEVLQIMKGSLPYAILIFLMSVYNRADAMMIERLCTDGKNQAGIWAAAFRLLDMANMFGLMFATMLLPMFGRMLAGKDSNIRQLVRLCVNMMLPLSFLVATAAVLFRGDIMHLLYRKSELYAQHALTYEIVFSFLMVSFPAWCLMYVYSTLLTANGSMKIMNGIAVVGVLFNLSLNFYMIPKYGAVGGAITSFLTQSLLALAFLFFAARVARLPFNFRWLMAHLAFLCLVGSLGFVLVTYTHFNWILQLALLSGVAVMLMFMLRFVSAGAIRQLRPRASV